MKDQEPIGKRLEKLIYHYRLNKYSFSQRIESASSIISRVIAEPGRSLSLELIQRIAENFPDVSIEWLVLGEGPMLKRSSEAETKTPMIKHYKRSLDNPSGYIYAEGYEDCDAAFDVLGDAMLPRFLPGDIVIGRSVTKPVFGQTHFLQTDDLPIMRNIAGQEGDALILKAENSRYEDLYIKTSEVKKIYIIKGVIRRMSY